MPAQISALSVTAVAAFAWFQGRAERLTQNLVQGPGVSSSWCRRSPGELTIHKPMSCNLLKFFCLAQRRCTWITDLDVPRVAACYHGLEPGANYIADGFPSLVQAGSTPPPPGPTNFATSSLPQASLYLTGGGRPRATFITVPSRPDTHRFSKAIRARPGDASLYWGRSHAWERAGNRRQAVVDAGVGVCLRPRVAAGFDRLSAAFEAQGRQADVVRACFLVSGEGRGGWASWGGE